MQFLVGESGKSCVIDLILKYTKSMCVVYDETLLFNKDIYVLNPKRTTVEMLLSDIITLDERSRSIDGHYDYLIIYTNLGSNDVRISKLCDFFKNNNLCFRDIIITCKP